MTASLITSQSYINEDTVAEKIAASDFVVQVSPEFEFCGETFRVILDGHHSFAAAIKAGVAPVIVEQDANDNDRIALIENGDIEGFLEACWMDGEYRYAATGNYVW